MTAFFQTLLPLPLYVILFECMLTKQVATKRWNCERFLKAKLLCRTCPWNWRWLSIETRKLFGWRWTWFAGKDLEGTICFFSFDWESSVDWSLIMRGRVWFVNVCGCSTSSMLPSGKRVGITSLIGMISESIDAGQHAAVVTHGHRNGNICLNYLVYSAIVTSFRAGFSHQCLHATKERKQNFIHTPYTTFSSIIIWQNSLPPLFRWVISPRNFMTTPPRCGEIISRVSLVVCHQGTMFMVWPYEWMIP